MLFDYNGDGKPDIFLASAVVEDGKVRDLLLRNDGNGTFTDVTAEAGLATARPSLGAAAADYDNDGKPDLVVTGAGEQHLFRNVDGKRFEDVSGTAGLDKVKGVCLGCGWLDIDQDGDLDLVLCKYADGDAGSFDGAKPGGEVILFENVGIAPPGKKSDPLPLTTAFRRSDKLTGLIPAGSYVNFVATDIDNDKDTDLLVFAEGADPAVLENDRLMRFKRPAPAWLAKNAHKWNGGLVLDANHDERSDLFLVRTGAAPVYLLSKGARDFEPGNTDSPVLKQAVAADIDMDGWTDLVGLGADGTVGAAAQPGRRPALGGAECVRTCWAAATHWPSPTSTATAPRTCSCGRTPVSSCTATWGTGTVRWRSRRPAGRRSGPNTSARTPTASAPGSRSRPGRTGPARNGPPFPPGWGSRSSRPRWGSASASRPNSFASSGPIW